MSDRSDSPPPLEPADADYSYEPDQFGDIFTYRDRPLSITICIGIGEQPLPLVSVRVFHDREYLDSEQALHASWMAYTRELEARLAQRLTLVIREVLLHNLMVDMGLRIHRLQNEIAHEISFAGRAYLDNEVVSLDEKHKNAFAALRGRYKLRPSLTITPRSRVQRSPARSQGLDGLPAISPNSANHSNAMRVSSLCR
ncbi:uncharacterized protein TRAVEDRAFT_47608 [Trametes versicolor FP-101664 SS1]|uniref:uncharacterized protein n=1 Tax=Trametes versicolor (strain FP-101664) TaxID=717944 RepID=UPI0004622327|nr:uncharacterized protein TRAVEDRAFT_47608 [Trametes versicolor FP-101664 SS1]EIW58452.1 hypothetical protein TRAVEDRAFT_47608 [Trametes versicolor FP-101664 SS1]